MFLIRVRFLVILGCALFCMPNLRCVDFSDTNLIPDPFNLGSLFGTQLDDISFLGEAGISELLGDENLQHPLLLNAPLDQAPQDPESCVKDPGSSEDAAGDDDAGQTACEDMRTSLDTQERYECLMRRLEKTSLGFADVRADYGGRLHIFQADILQAMHKGFDISEDDGRYRCLGRLRENPKPTECVSVAMFNLIRQNTLSLFDLRFQLYKRGYRSYSPEYLVDLEKALAVGAVHPDDRRVEAKSDVRAHEWLQSVWQRIRDFSKSDAQAYLNDVDDNGRKKVPKKYRKILWRLWKMQSDGDLEALQALKVQRSSEDSQEQSLRPKGSMTMNHQSKRHVLAFLQARKNQTLSVESILDAASVQSRSGKVSELIETVILLALDGWPILYDKESASVTFLDRDFSVDQPLSGRNLLTVVYDLVQQYGRKINHAEIAYYVRRGGYWPKDIPDRDVRAFYKHLRWCKNMLAICGYTTPGCCSSADRVDVARKRALFDAMQKEKRERGLSYYESVVKGVTQEDMNVVENAIKLLETPDFVVLSEYVWDLNVRSGARMQADRVQAFLSSGPLPLSSLAVLCRAFGMEHEEGIWGVLRPLTQRERGGRLLYDPKTTTCVWDNADSYHAIEESMYVAEIYSLQKDYPHMSQQELSHMLTQRGVRNAAMINIQNVLFGLELLGFRPISEGVSVLSRDTLMAILTSGDAHAPGEDDCSVQRQSWEVAQEVCSWISNGAMERLCAAISAEDAESLPQEDVRGSEEEEPCCKRQKLASDSGDITASNTEELLDILLKNGVLL